MILDEVKTSCLESLQHSGIQLNEDGMRRFLENLDQDDWNKFYQEHGTRFPLKFSDALDELNFLSILTVLNFLSAYRIPLHRRTGQGAYDAIRRFVLSCYLAQPADEKRAPLSARGMATMTEATVSELLGVPIMVEKAHPTLPVKIGERDPEAAEIVGLVRGVMNQTGKVLLEKQKKDLGTFVSDLLKANEAQSAAERTAILVQTLVDAFPAFADHGEVKGHTVKVYKKAQLLAFIIATEFKDREDVPFPLPDPTVVTACVDNVVPTMAVHFELLDLTKCVYPLYANGLGQAGEGGKKVEGLRQNAEEAYAIRAATVAACERVVELTGEVADKTGKEWLKTMTSMNLDGYLWQKAKDGKLRDLPRLSEPGTIFY